MKRLYIDFMYMTTRFATGRTNRLANTSSHVKTEQFIDATNMLMCFDTAWRKSLSVQAVNSRTGFVQIIMLFAKALTNHLMSTGRHIKNGRYIDANMCFNTA